MDRLDDLEALLESKSLEDNKLQSALPKHLEAYSAESVNYTVQDIVKAVDNTTVSYDHLRRNYPFREKHGQDNAKINAAIEKLAANDKTSTPLLRSKVIYDKIGTFAGRIVNGNDHIATTYNRHLGELTPDEQNALDQRARESGSEGLYQIGITFLKPEKYNHAGLVALLLSGRLEQEAENLTQLITKLPPETADEYKQVLSMIIKIQRKGGTVKFPFEENLRSSLTYDIAPGGKIKGRIFGDALDESGADTSLKLVLKTLSPNP